MKLRPMMAMLFAASAASLVAATATAQPNTDPHWVQRDKFRGLDKNGDGYLTRNELSQFRDYGPAFDKADENRDARLSVEEFIQAEAIHDRQRAAAYTKDAALTARVKTALLRENDLKSLDVSVETDKGRVQLSGWVESEAQRKKALLVAKGVDGVKEVRDAMSVR